MKIIPILLFTFFGAHFSSFAQTKDATGSPQHYVYILTLNGKFKKEKNWTESQTQTVCAMISYLTQLSAAGKVQLAGRTNYPYDQKDQFGMVILEVGSKSEALEIMKNDPAVRSGLMKAKIHELNIPVGNTRLLTVVK